MPTAVNREGHKMSSALNALAGVWLALSPWIFGAGENPDAWNSWILGALILLVAVTRYSMPSRGLSMLNMVFGAWVFVSPWVFAYTANTGRFMNSLFIGAIVFIVAAGGLVSARRTREEYRS